MKDLIRRFKISYQAYNFFQKEKLVHNLDKYKKAGINKRYFSSVSSKDFKKINPEILRPDAHLVNPSETALYQTLDENSKRSIDHFHEDGYAILSSFVKPEVVDSINHDIARLLEDKKVGFRYGKKIMFAIHQSRPIAELGKSNALNELLSSLIEGDATLFQSINFINGSEQETHSDSIHMTTFPLGGLLGVWIALEDIDNTNGPLHYYPKSQKLPYYLNSDYDNEGSALLIGSKDYSAYERMLAEKIRELNLEKKIFRAKKGDLLIWHANLLHGGEPHTDKNRTRKSMVFHYYDSNRICYHEISQRPALIQAAI